MAERIEYNDKTQSGSYDAAKWNAQDATEVKTVVDSHADDIEALETEKAPIANPTFTGTVSGVTKAMVGLSNVDNTADVNKPLSSATQTALDAKAPIVSPTFTGTVGGITKSMVGLGSVDNTADDSKPVSTAQAAAIGLKVDKTTTVNSKALSGNISLNKTDIGLSNVDNTSDVNKPISASTSNALILKADLEDGVLKTDQIPDIPLDNLPESNLPQQIDDVTIKVNGSDKIAVNVDGVALVVVDGAITIDIAWLQAQIDSSALPIPDALIDPTVDNGTRLFTCSPNPAQPEYDNAQWETSVNNGVSYVDNTNLQDPFDVGAGGKAIGQVKTRIKAVGGSNRSGVPTSNLTAFTAVGDDDLITGYTYSPLDLFTGTPPLINTNNNYNIGTDGYGKGQPLKKIPVGAAVAFQYQALSSNSSFILKDTPDTLDGGTVLEISVTTEGVVHVFDSRDSIDEDLATQPTVGQFVNIAHVSDEAANLSTWRISVLDDAAGSFAEVWGKNFTLSYVSGSTPLVQFNTIGGSSTVFKPQGLNLTNY